MTIKDLEEKYGKEEVRKAEKILRGLIWIGDGIEQLEAILKRPKGIYS